MNQSNLICSRTNCFSPLDLLKLQAEVLVSLHVFQEGSLPINLFPVVL